MAFKKPKIRKETDAATGSTKYTARWTTEGGKKRQQSVRKSSEDHGNRIRPGALAELTNPETVLMLGGRGKYTITYLHGHNTYFRMGVKTAARKLEDMLEQLVSERRSIIKRKVIEINNEWSRFLKPIGFDAPNITTSFADFRTMWRAIMNDQDNEPNVILKAMVTLQKFKESAFAYSRVRNSIDSAIAEIKNGRSSAQLSLDDAAKIAEKASENCGFAIEIGYDASKQELIHMPEGSNNKKWQDEYRKQGKEALEFALNQLSKHPEALTQLYQYFGENLFNSIKKGHLSKLDSCLSTVHTSIGNLGEFIISDIVDFHEKNAPIMGGNLVSLQIESVASEKKLSKKKRASEQESIDKKGDTNLKGKANVGKHEYEFNIMSSDKISQAIEWFAAQNSDGTRIVDEFFHNTLKSSALDFSNYKVESPVFKAQEQNLNSLFNYVFRNENIFGVSAESRAFKKLVIYYAAWLKIIHAIIGNPDLPIDDTPLIVRTAHDIYNTADILNIFSNLPSRKILEYIYEDGLKKQINKLWSAEGVFTPGERVNLQKGKQLAIANLKNQKQKITYRDIYLSRVMQKTLKDIALASHNKSSIQGFNVSMHIKLNSFKTILKM